MLKVIFALTHALKLRQVGLGGLWYECRLCGRLLWIDPSVIDKYARLQDMPIGHLEPCRYKGEP